MIKFEIFQDAGDKRQEETTFKNVGLSITLNESIS